MALITGLVLSLIFLEWPWQLAVVIPLALLEAFEVTLWLRWRRVRTATGPEGIVGMRGVAVSECRPEGQVKVKGQLWKARCAAGVDRGAEVVVRGVTGLRLEVAPAPRD